MQTFFTIAGDQRVIAGAALLLFSLFMLGCYITRKERKSQNPYPGYDPNELGDWPQ